MSVYSICIDLKQARAVCRWHGTCEYLQAFTNYSHT